MKNKANCLTRSLDQWAERPDIFRLWYNSNHVIALENRYDGRVLIGDDVVSCYLPLTDYGFVYFDGAFRDWLTHKYRKLLLRYFDYLMNLAQ